MLVAGDEFGRTQQGNNNAYCQDNEISWLNWDLKDKGKHLVEFVQKLTSLRHKFPILRRGRFYTGVYNEALGVKDLTWINANGQEMQQEHWRDHDMRCFGMLMDGRAQRTGIQKPGDDATLLLVLNAHWEMVEFTLPESYGGNEWVALVDTNREENEAGSVHKTGETYGVTARSLLLFALKSKNAQSGHY